MDCGGKINPAPYGDSDRPLYTFQDYELPSALRLAPKGTPLYPTTWTNIGPRLGVAWQFHLWILRGGFGLFHDLGAGLLGQAVSSFPYYRQRIFIDGALFPLPEEAAHPPAFSVQPPVASIYGAVKHLALPITTQWSAAIERSLSPTTNLSFSYVAAGGKAVAAHELPGQSE